MRVVFLPITGNWLTTSRTKTLQYLGYRIQTPAHEISRGRGMYAVSSACSQQICAEKIDLHLGCFRRGVGGFFEFSIMLFHAYRLLWIRYTFGSSGNS